MSGDRQGDFEGTLRVENTEPNQFSIKWRRRGTGLEKKSEERVTGKKRQKPTGLNGEIKAI